MQRLRFTSKSRCRTRRKFGETAAGYIPRGSPAISADGRPDKANCTSGSHESHGYRGLPKGSVPKGYLGNSGVIALSRRFLVKGPGANCCANGAPTQMNSIGFIQTRKNATAGNYRHRRPEEEDSLKPNRSAQKRWTSTEDP